MKLKTLILVITALILFNCQTKKKAVEILKEKKEEITKKELDSLTIKKDSVVHVIEKAQEVNNIVDDNNGEIIIKGKTDSLSDFNFHNIIGKDTVNSIWIHGNANFEIKNNWKKTETKSQESRIEKNLNVVAEVARTVVAKETLKKAAQEIKNVARQAKSTGFPLAIYIIGGLVALCLILAVYFWTQIKGYFSFLTKFKKKE